MSSLRIRPRFKHSMQIAQDELENAICGALENHEQFTFHYLPGHIYIKVAPKHRHFWSPQLHLSIEPDEDRVILRGLYGPNPSLWAVFFFGYVILGLLATVIGVWGFSLWSLGKSSSILWAIPAIGVIAITLYIAGQIGQKLGAQQMFDIHHFYEKLTKDKIVVS